MSWTRRLGLGALALGAAAPFAGSPYRAGRGLDVAETAGVIARGEDHVTALELAEWIRGRKAGLRVIDVRSAREFTAHAIPTAENLPIEQIATASFAPEETVVLYSEGGAHAGQAWVLLRAMGLRRVLFVAGGLVDWDAEVMQPTLRDGAGPDEVRAFEQAADLSRYFGGEPRIGVAAAEVSQPALRRRRGC